MSGALVNILNKVLGSWIEDLNTEQFSLSIFSGIVELENLQLKPDIFQVLGLPIKLQTSKIGRIQIKIPWTSWYSSPLTVSIRDLNIILSPNSPEYWTEQDAKSLILKTKTYLLQQFEAIHEDGQDFSSSFSFLGSLSSKIVRNLCLEIQNFYIRFEDASSFQVPFSIGCYMKELQLYNCNELWQLQDSPTGDRFKLMLVDHLSVFLDYEDGIVISGDWYEGSPVEVLTQLSDDERSERISHKFILHPFSARLELILAEGVQSDLKAKVSMRVLTNLIDLDMNIHQILILVKFQKFLTTYSNYIKGIEREVLKKKLDIEGQINYQAAYRKYRKRVREGKVSQEKIEKLKKKIEKIEEGVAVDEILIERRHALMELKIDKLQQEKEKEVNALNNQGGRRFTHKLADFFHRKTDEQIQHEEHLRKQRVTVAENDLKRVFMRTNSIIKQVASNLTERQPASLIKWLVEMKIGKVSVMLKEDSKDYLSLEVYNISVKSTLRPYSQTFAFSMTDLWIFNLYSNSSFFPKFLDGKHLIVEYDTYGNKFLKVSSAGLSMCLDLTSVFHIISKIQQSFATDRDWIRYLEEISDTTDRYIQQGSAYLKEAFETGVNSKYVLDIDIKAPFIAIPSDVHNKEAPLLLIDFGKLSATTFTKSLSSSEYHVYKFNLDDIHIFTENLDTGHPDVLEPTQVTLELYTSELLEHLALDDPSLCFRVVVDKLKTRFTDKNMQIIGDYYKNYSEISALLVNDTETLAKNTSTTDRKPKTRRLFQLQINEIALTAAVEGKSKVSFFLKNIKIRIQDLKVFTKKVKVMIGSFGLLDLRDQTFPVNVIQQSFEKTEAVAIPGRQLQMILSGTVDNFRNISDFSVKVSGLSLNVEVTFLQSLTSILQNFNEKFDDNSLVALRPTVSLSRPSVTVYYNSRVSCQVENCRLRLPVAEAKSWTSMDMNMNLSITLISEQKVDKRINKHNIEVWRQLSESKFECNLMVNHLQLNLNVDDHSKNLIRSSRVSVDYLKTSAHGAVPETQIQTRMESLQLVLGFRDLDYILKVRAKWFAYLFPKSDVTSEFISSHVIDFDSLQVTIQDDTVSEQLSLAYLQFSNFLYSISNHSGDYKSLLTTVFFINFYNKTNGIWEPFIEDWKFSYSYSQKSPEQPQETVIESKDPMNVNITKEMCETLGIIYTKYYQTPSDWLPVTACLVQPKASIDYEFFNQLGIDVQVFFVDLEQDSFFLPATEKNLIKNSEMKKIFSKKKPKNKFEAGKLPNPVFCLVSQGYAQVIGLTLNDVGTEKFVLQSQNEKVSCRKEIQIIQDVRQIVFYRDFVVRNLAGTEVVLFCKFEKQVVASSEFFLPIVWDLADVKVRTCRGLKTLKSGSFEVEDGVFVFVQIQDDCLNGGSSSISITAPYSFINQLPCSINITAQEETVAVVQPGQTGLLTFAPFDPALEFQVELDLVDSSIHSQKFSIKDSLSTLSLLKKPGWELQTQVSVDSGSSCLKLFSQFLLVNSSEFPLAIGEVLVDPKQIGFFSSNSEEIRVKTCGEFSSKWSEKFNPKAVGVSSCLFLQLSNPVVRTLTLGLKVFQAPWPLVQTKVIKVVPRFVFVNFLDFKIYFKQVCKIASRIVEIEPKKAIEYQFDDVELGTVVQVSEDKLQWSGPFDCSVFEDFQIRFKAAPREIPPKTNIFAFDTHWFLPCARNHLYFYIRVNVSSEDDACIKITLSLPLIPSFRIYNSLQEPLQIKQSKTKTEVEVIPPGSSLPWAFFDNTLKNKKVTVKNAGHKKHYSLEKIKEKNKDLGPYLVSIDFEGECRVLRVYEAEETFSHLEIGLMKKVIEKTSRKTELKLTGVHFSLLDQENNEKFLLSLQEFHWKMTRAQEKKNKQAKVRVKYHLILAGLQVDNMKVDRNLFPVMAFHSQVNELTPWCEFRYDREFTTGSIDSKYFTPIDRILEFELQMQPLTLNLNLETLFSFISLSDLYYKYFYSLHSSQFASSLSRCPISEAFPQLAPVISIPESCPRSVKSYFKYIRIHGSKFILTFSNTESVSESNRSDISHSMSEFVLDLANIENSTLKFTEIILQYSFQNFSNLFTILMKNYVRQGLLQFYRILGSSELLGNPIGLIDKLGTGVYEFFNEPAKGLLQGPNGFVMGMGKGVKSLVSNVIGGSFESVSKITGSLYKIVGQDKAPGTSVYQKLGLQDLASGVTGIVTKPYVGLKTRGAAGLVLGVGTGVFGALVSPVAAVLHFSSTVSSEVARTANKLHNFQSHRGRVRFPRFLNNKKILEHYDHDLAKVRFFLAVKEFKDSDILALVELIQEFVILTKDKLFILVGEEIVDEHSIKDFFIKEVHLLKKLFILKLAGDQKSLCISSKLYAPIFKLFTAIKLSN